MSFWPFHTHRFELVSRAYAAPTHGLKMNGPAGIVSEMAERAQFGCTTLTWKCADPACTTVVQSVSLGKESGETSGT